MVQMIKLNTICIDEEEDEENNLEVTKDGGMHEEVNSDDEGDVLEGFVDNDL